MKKTGWTVFAVLLSVTISRAQDTPKADIAVEYSGLYILKGYTIWNDGVNGSAAFNINDWLGFAGDLGTYHGNVGTSLNGQTYMVGPRVSYRRLGPGRLVPFAQALFGGSHFNINTGGITGGGTQFTFALGGGTDLVAHRGKFAIRLEGDYVGIRSGGSTTPAARVSAGITYRIGRKSQTR